MKTFEESPLETEEIRQILEVVDRHVRAQQARTFLTGLLRLIEQKGSGWYTRQQIGGVVGLDPDRCTSNVWVSNKALTAQFELHRARMSEGLGGRLLDLRQQGEHVHEYTIEVIELTEADIPFRLEGSVLRYRLSDEPPRLSWVGRIHHPGVGAKPEDYRKWYFLMPFFVECGVALFAALMTTAVAAVTLLGVPFSMTTYLYYAGFTALVIWGIGKRWGRLFEDRSLLLSINDVAGSGEGVILDREKVDDVNHMVLRRYVASCPICSTALIGLALGEPHFKRRIVGRCEDSPREHVFSFDGVTLEGAPLIQRPARAGTS